MPRAIERRRVLRWDALIMIGTLISVGAVPVWTEFSESRMFRDMMNQTPFSRVRSEAVLEPTGLTVFGSMRKERCIFDGTKGLTAYLTMADGRRIRFPVDTSPEDTRGVTGNRPVSGLDETWGPWRIYYSGGLGVATWWEIYATHKGPPDNCFQTNLFAQGAWTSKLKKER